MTGAPYDPDVPRLGISYLNGDLMVACVLTGPPMPLAKILASDKFKTQRAARKWFRSMMTTKPWEANQ